MIDIKTLFVDQKLSLREALAKLDATAQGLLLMVNEQQHLVRTITDGDIRRMLLNGYTLDTTLTELPVSTSKVITNGQNPSFALALMDEYSLDQIPVLDETGVPQMLIHRRNIPTSILLSTPHLGEFEQQYVAEAFQTNWVAPLGPNVDAFEQEIAEMIGVPHAAALSSGTAALHLALRLLNIGAGDTVFCSSFTFVASANPILYQQATPVFIDSEPSTWNMSPQALNRALIEAAAAGNLPKAVIVTHLYGQSADMDALLELCNTYNVPIVEDAAESLGAFYKGRATGSMGKFGIFSFNGNKIITTSGGGMLVAHDETLIKRAKFLSTQARDPAPHYEHTEVGYNYRMSNVLAGIGRGQLKVLEQRVTARRAIFERYVTGLANIPAITWMPETKNDRATRWLSAMIIDPKLTRVTPGMLLAYLAQNQIEARPVWKPMHLQPLYQNCAYYSHTPDKSISDELFSWGVCLPSGSNLSEKDQARVIETIHACFKS